jgi:predicted Zn finger-like uncharacterized protein
MFTVCPKCTLTLAVTANDLRMGQGYVRCGRCANVFNALLTLSEEPVEESSASARGASPASTPADRASSSQITAALREAAPEHAAPSSEWRSQAEPAAGPSIHLATEKSSDGSIENESNFADGTGTFETIVLEGDAITQTEEYVPEESVDSEIAALTQRLEMAAQEPVAMPLHESDADNVADAIDAEVLEELPPLTNAATPRPRWPWIAGSVVLLLLLAVQAIHHWRDALAASPSWNATLSRTYAAIGLPLDPHWDLAAYDVRQQGAVADPSDSQIIRVRLSLANRAARAQPLPLLRLTLRDRYGKRVAASELTPGQYWPTGVAPRTSLGRDERVDSEIAVRDPSAASASFELDVCLRGSTGTLRCASDAASNPTTAGAVPP